MATIINGHALGNGVNLQPSYYNNGQVNFGWDLMKQQPKIKSLRIEIEPDKVNQAANWIAAAQNHGYQVIATYHKSGTLGSNNKGLLLDAATWWQDNYQILGGNFIINLMNEWGNHNITAEAHADGYNEAIAMVRQVYNGQIVIDLPGWGQDTHIAYEALHPQAPLITDPYIVLSVHLYRSSWNARTGEFVTTADLDHLSKTGKPCVVGEFGIGSAGECDWQRCVNHARNELGWTIVGWCWNGDGNGLNMVNPAWNTNPTASTFTKGGYFDVIYSKL